MNHVFANRLPGPPHLYSGALRRLSPEQEALQGHVTNTWDVDGAALQLLNLVVQVGPLVQGSQHLPVFSSLEDEPS